VFSILTPPGFGYTSEEHLIDFAALRHSNDASEVGGTEFQDSE